MNISYVLNISILVEAESNAFCFSFSTFSFIFLVYIELLKHFKGARVKQGMSVFEDF